MSNKLLVLIFAIFCWLMTFTLLVASAFQADCFFIQNDYQRNLLIAAFTNLICVVVFIAFSISKEGE